MQNSISNSRRDLFIAVALFIGAFALYVRTLAPSVAFIFDDSLEMQYIIPRLGIPHPTGYPLYAILGKIFTLVVPLNDPAFRLNLFSALAAALTIPIIYFALRQITNYRFASILGAILFAVSRTFWEQAVIAEVYALQMLLTALILLAAFRYGREPSPRNLYWLAFAMGLGLTHHRLVVLLFPGIAIYVLLHMSFRGSGETEKSPPLQSRFLATLEMTTVFRAALIFLAPLLLYLYLPLRGSVSSADGTYENTLMGFLTWASGAQYGAFLDGNPLNVQHDLTFFVSLFTQQFSILGLVLAAIGAIWLARKPRELTLLALALIAEAIFAFNYRTADVEVHFLTTFLLLAIFAGAGADAVLRLDLRDLRMNFLQTVYRSLFTILLLTLPAQLLFINFQPNDLSNKWDVHDYAIDLLAQPTEPNATLIGILGEVTLARYFQANLGLRPDLQTVPADKESDRLNAIDNALKQNRVVYLTRSLKGAAEKYSLDSLGPLIRVRTKAAPDAPLIANPVDADFGAVRLIGYAVDASRLGATQDWHAQNGRVLRVTLFWKADEKPSADALVSVKILGTDHRVAGQLDQHPVHDAYPTNTWRAGEIIADTYDVPVFLGAPPGNYAVSVTMYDPGSGAVFGSRDLQTIALAPDLIAPRRDAWNIAHTSDADFGAFALAGYTLETEAAIRPGDALPLTLLWRANQSNINNGIKARLWLEDDEGKSNASRDVAIGQSFPVSQWQAGQFVRETPIVRVPANVADGTYRVKLAVARGEQLLGGILFRPSTADLGFVEIKNRARVMTAPGRISRPQEVTFDNKIRLLGSDFTIDSARTARLTLYWKSLALMDTSYTVFVHLLDAKDQVIASGDAAPEFTTTGWVADEIIADAHSFAIPAEVARGAYRIEIGWYNPGTGARLKTSDGQERVLIAPIDLP